MPQIAEWLVDSAMQAGAAGEGRPRAGATEGANDTLHDDASDLALDLALDLGATAVVLPGARAGRLLLWHLATLARASGRRLVPPTTVTPGSMVSLLLEEVGRCASPLARECAMATALRGLDPALRRALFPTPASAATPQGTVSDRTWIDVVQPILALVDELAGEGITGDDVADVVSSLPDRSVAERETLRWRGLAALERGTASILGEHGLREGARVEWEASDRPPRPHRTVERLVLAVVPELNGVQRRGIRRFAAGGGALVSLVHADEEHLALLDQFGALRRARDRHPGDGATDSMADHAPHAEPVALIPDDELLVVESAADAAQCAVAAALEPAAREGLTIGLLDPSLVGALEHAGRYAGVTFRPASGRLLASTEPVAALTAIAEWLHRDGGAGGRGRPDPASFARLPAPGAWLRAALERQSATNPEFGGPEAVRGDLVAALDDATRALRPGGERLDAAPAVAAREAVEQLLRPLTEGAEAGRTRALATWAPLIRAVLAELLATLDAEPNTTDAVEAIVTELAAWSELPESIGLRLTAVEAVHHLISRLSAQRLPAETRRDDVEALGLLELHPDDAPMVVLLGMHEGSVPRTRAADAFLPNALRQRLGLTDDAAGARRDAYLLAAVRRGRTAVRVVVARRSPNGDPVLASRLLLRGPRAMHPARLRRLAGEGVPRFGAPLGLAAPAARSRFVVPPPPNGPIELTRISVTAFRSYLACPYRYWLERHLRLRAIDPLADQFDSAEFGTLAHAALSRWAGDRDSCDSRDPTVIAAGLDAALDTELLRAAQGGDIATLPVAMLVQAARLRQRFEAFALRQALHRQQGWRIDRVEWDLPEDAQLEFPQIGAGAQGSGAELPSSDPRAVEAGSTEPVRITGRIDRIDRHETTGELLLLDYKTADAPRTPDAAHTRRDQATGERRWIDLQLPLYGYVMARVARAQRERESGGAAPAGASLLPPSLLPPSLLPSLGYVLLPRDAAAVEIAFAPWQREDLVEATDVARDVVQRIRRGEFPMNPNFAGHDRFARICHANALGFAGDEADGGGEAT